MSLAELCTNELELNMAQDGPRSAPIWLQKAIHGPWMGPREKGTTLFKTLVYGRVVPGSK